MTAVDPLIERAIAWRTELGDEWTITLWAEFERSIEMSAVSSLLSGGVSVADLRLLEQEKHPWGFELFDELHGEQANFGAASDILRVAILFKFGGFYSDLDNFPDKNISQLKMLAKTSELLVGVFTDPKVINNAALGASPGHPFLTLYLEQLVAQYRSLYAPVLEDIPMSGETRERLMQALQHMGSNKRYRQRIMDAVTNYNVSLHRYVDRMDTTLNLSGPRLLRWCLEKYINKLAVSYPDYLRNLLDSEVAMKQYGTLKKYLIPTDVIRITSEGSWIGVRDDSRFDEVDQRLVSALSRAFSDWLEDVD